MKVKSCNLKPVLGIWEDPGDYPSGAGSGPLPSETFVEYVDGTVEVELSVADWEAINDYADIDMTTTKMIEAWLKDNPAVVEHGEGWLTVKSWCLEQHIGDLITLTVDEFEAQPPDYGRDDE